MSCVPEPQEKIRQYSAAWWCLLGTGTSCAFASVAVASWSAATSADSWPFRNMRRIYQPSSSDIAYASNSLSYPMILVSVHYFRQVSNVVHYFWKITAALEDHCSCCRWISCKHWTTMMTIENFTQELGQTSDIVKVKSSGENSKIPVSILPWFVMIWT